MSSVRGCGDTAQLTVGCKFFSNSACQRSVDLVTGNSLGIHPWALAQPISLYQFVDLDPCNAE